MLSGILRARRFCLHCCGAIRPIAADLSDLGVEIVNFDFNARGMGIDKVP